MTAADRVLIPRRPFELLVVRISAPRRRWAQQPLPIPAFSLRDGRLSCCVCSVINLHAIAGHMREPPWFGLPWLACEHWLAKGDVALDALLRVKRDSHCLARTEPRMTDVPPRRRLAQAPRHDHKKAPARHPALSVSGRTNPLLPAIVAGSRFQLRWIRFQLRWIPFQLRWISFPASLDVRTRENPGV